MGLLMDTSVFNLLSIISKFIFASLTKYNSTGHSDMEKLEIVMKVLAMYHAPCHLVV